MKKLIIIGALLLTLALPGLAQVITPGMSGVETRNALNTAFSEVLGVVDSVNETIRIGGVQITANAAEVNILDNALVNVTELNRLVGLSGNIMTLLGGKAPTNNANFTGTFTMPVPYTAGTTEVIDVVNYTTQNYSTTGTGNIVLSTGATLTTVNITDLIKLTPTVSPPSGATEGMIYMDTDHHLYVYNATTWMQLDN